MTEFDSIKVNFRQRNGMYIISAPEVSNVLVMHQSWAVVRDLCDSLIDVVIPVGPPKKKETL